MMRRNILDFRVAVARGVGRRAQHQIESKKGTRGAIEETEGQTEVSHFVSTV